MLIGKKGEARSAIATADETSITVRGRDLCSDIMGRMSFTAYFFFHVTGQEPTPEQVYFMDAVLVTIAEHGLTPSAQASRLTLAAAPESLQGAVAAGILGSGSVVLGSGEEAARYIAECVQKAKVEERAIEEVAREMLDVARRAKRKFPGFGHPLHKPEDPRSVRLLQLADERGVSSEHVRALRALAALIDGAYGRRLPINFSGAMAAVMLDLRFPVNAIKGIPVLARTAGLLGHLAEEMERPIAFYMAHVAETAVTYDGGTPANE